MRGELSEWPATVLHLRGMQDYVWRSGVLCGLSQSPKPKEGSDVEQRFAYGFTLAKKLGFVKDGDTVVLAYGWQSGMSSLTNFKMTTVTPESTKVTRAPTSPRLPPLSLLLCSKIALSGDCKLSVEIIRDAHRIRAGIF